MKYPCAHVYAVTQLVWMSMFGVRWHSQFQHFYGRAGQDRWTEIFDSMMAAEFDNFITARKDEDGEGKVLCVDGMEFLSGRPASWLSIQEEQNPMVIEAKHLYQLT
ncbi:hypothetical protein IV203_034283 [Nitzschia inconspicua]|uniref:Uncharacterized protein n=1 Tax=Nitzschia inconspicua TaxID=303405 RepID=A0A9K3Q9N6_9STRA|nr:hypothetical protein IV203_034283 [Nitzschia inconspicua]